MVHASTRTPRERRHEDNVQRILDAAMRMVEAGGIEALSINKLADEVDYTPGALYRYFSSKRRRCCRGWWGGCSTRWGCTWRRGQARLPVRARPLARVVVLVQAYRAFARREPRRFGLLAVSMADPRVLLREAADAGPLVGPTVAALSALAGALGAAAEAGQQKRATRPSGRWRSSRWCRGFCRWKSVEPRPWRARRRSSRHPGATCSAPQALEPPKAVDAALEQVDSLGDLAEHTGATP